MASAADAARSLIRTAVRTFFPNPRHSILVDLILAYNVLQVEELCLFLNGAQGKEVRALLNPLVSARLVSKGTRAEVKVGTGSGRATQREYHFVNYHEAVDAIKYRLVKLRERVEDIYKEEQGKRKDWSCPYCKAEFDEFEILDNMDLERGGFICKRCNIGELVQNEAAVRERGNHEKIRNLNDQMIPFNKLIGVIDSGNVPQNDFDTAWATKRDLPPDLQDIMRKRVGYMDVSQKGEEMRKTQAVVDASALETSIADEKTRAAEDAEAKRVKLEQSAKQNQLPAWHTGSAIGQNVKKEEGGQSPNPLGLKKEEEDEKKPIANAEERKIQDDMADYLAEMAREQQEAERVKAEESSEGEEDDEDDFEDIPDSSMAGTPASSQQMGVKQEISPSGLRTNGLKRELDLDGDSVSGTSTGANTPLNSSMTSVPNTKRVKLEAGDAKEEGPGQANGAAVDSDEDDDFEDV